jgi:putative membrane-bound dehydrogenase-like protein
MRFLLPTLFLLCPPFLQADDFPQPYNTQNASDVLTPPQQSLGMIQLPEGFQATLFAAEPDVQQPISLTFDDRGRLWVAECYTYAENKLNYDDQLRDRILIFEDSDGDGKFDKRTIFWDRGNRLTSIAVGFGGVWALCSPKLLFIPDQDGDDKPDGEPVVVLDGWNAGRVRHNIVNGLMWGHDGWLYGRHGIQDYSLVGPPGSPAEKRTRLSCSIWRYHPTRKHFEIVCEGTTNPWGMDFDDNGQMFFINTVIGHLWHIVPGAHFKRMYGEDQNPYVFQLIDQCADHYHWDTGKKWNEAREPIGATDRAGGGHAHCGMMIYLGDNWPSLYRGNVFTVNMLGYRLNRDRLERQGNGYIGTTPTSCAPPIAGFAASSWRTVPMVPSTWPIGAMSASVTNTTASIAPQAESTTSASAASERSCRNP